MTLATLERLRADRVAAVLRRELAGDGPAADARMPAVLRIERAIYTRFSAAGERKGAT